MLIDPDAPSTTAPATSAPLTSAPPSTTCAPPAHDVPDVGQVDHERLASILKSDPEFQARVRGEPGSQGPVGEPGVDGPTGPTGPTGPPGRDGKDAELTTEHIAAMTAAIIQTLKTDQEFLASVKGPQGDPGEAADLAGLEQRINALELAVNVTPGEEAHWSHLVLLADPKAEYWSRMQDELTRAQGYYHQLKHMEPPEDRDVGALPLLVAYQQGKPMRTWTGQRSVSQALSSITRGEWDAFLFTERGS